MTDKLIHPERYYIRDPEENWYIREDVGGYEYPEDGDNYRIGIIREVIQTWDDIAPLLDILESPFSETVKIYMVRAVITKDLLQFPPDPFKPLLANYVESIISLEDSGNAELSDCCQVVFSRHHTSRQTPGDVVLKELEVAEQIFADSKTKVFHPTSRDHSGERYTIERITSESDPSILAEYYNLIKETFGDGFEEMDTLLDNDTIVIGAISERNSQRSLLGGAYAWRDMTYLKRNSKDILLDTYEMSGAIVREKYRGKGIYQGIAISLLTFLAQRPEQVDVVFSYANLQERAALAVAAQTGKTLVTETARQLKLPIKPTMQLNRVNGQYVDDIVIYIPGEQLRRLYGYGYK